VLVFVSDQLSKLWVLDALGGREGAVLRVLGDVVWFRLVHNSGAAFGMLSDASLLFGLAAAAVAVGILWYSRRLAVSPVLLRVALGFELGGALGNLVDRLRFGYVVDFIDFRLNLRLWPWVFNVSDASITIGVLLLMLYLLRGGGDSAATEPVRERRVDE